MTWHPRGEATWPGWKKATPGLRIEHVRSGVRGTFRRAVVTRNGYAVIEWDNGHTGRVVAPAFDLRPIAYTAWDLIGFDGNMVSVPMEDGSPPPRYDEEGGNHIEYNSANVRIVGGRTLYEAVVFNDGTHGHRVRLDRLTNDLRVVNRYVDPDTPMEVIED